MKKFISSFILLFAMLMACGDASVPPGGGIETGVTAPDDPEVPQPDSKPEILSITTTSPDKTYFVGDAVNITVTFSEPVELSGGMLEIGLNTGAVISIAPFSFFSTVSVLYIVGTEDTSSDLLDSMGLNITGGTLMDADSNSLIVALPEIVISTNSSIAIDTVGPVKETTFSVMTYNVQARSILDVTKDKMITIGSLANAYDIVGTQETMVYYDELISENNHISRFWFDDLHGIDGHCCAIVGSGLANLSYFPLIETQTINYDYKNDTEDIVASKGMVMMRYDVDGMILDVYNTHMEAGGAPEDEPARFNQTTQVLEFINANSPSTHNIIVMGDFNMSPARLNKAYEDFNPNEYREDIEGFSDMESRTNIFQRMPDELGLLDASDTLFGPIYDHIDRFLYRSAQGHSLVPLSWDEVVEPFVTDEGNPLSDHLPITATFRLTRNNNIEYTPYSIRVTEPEEGKVWLYRNCDYWGGRREISAGELWTTLDDPFFEDNTSSVKVGPNTTLTLYENSDFTGLSAEIDSNVSCLDGHVDFYFINDLASSAEVSYTE